MPRVSVIVPAHNAAEFLPAALKSVREQTFGDWEVVSVDDGSSDGTWEILEAAGSRVRAIRNASARGPAAARNQALRQASGDLAVFLDADDLLRPQYLESQVACLEQARRAGRAVGIVASDALLLDGEDYANHTYLTLTRHRGRPLDLERVLRRNPIYICALVPVEVGAAVGWFDEELFGTEDFGLWVKILERGFEAILNPEPLAVYRRRGGTVSTNIASQGLNNRRVYELALARGALTAHQRRIARKAIRYNRAMEAVAAARFNPGKHSTARLLRLLPLVAWVVATNPQWWRQWLAVLRAGRLPSARKRSIKLAQG